MKGLVGHSRRLQGRLSTQLRRSSVHSCTATIQPDVGRSALRHVYNKHALFSTEASSFAFDISEIMRACVEVLCCLLFVRDKTVSETVKSLSLSLSLSLSSLDFRQIKCGFTRYTVGTVNFRIKCKQYVNPE